MATMPTLEEELEALKGALSVMESRHLSDIKQLIERINTLQQQLDEQQRRISGQVQSINLSSADKHSWSSENIEQHIKDVVDDDSEEVWKTFLAIEPHYRTTNRWLAES
jgi:capsule polysaccharide export protein KpsE/RkpR